MSGLRHTLAVLRSLGGGVVGLNHMEGIPSNTKRSHRRSGANRAANTSEQCSPEFEE
jgi:hypothetical protein